MRLLICIRFTMKLSPPVEEGLVTSCNCELVACFPPVLALGSIN
jgi:hypothetical protein